MQSRTIAIAALLLVVGCNGNEKARQAAAAKSAEAKEIDERAKVIAEAAIKKAADDAEKKHEADVRQKADALKQLRQNVIDHPGSFLESSKLQMDAGKRHLTSIALTNKSKFSMTEIRGTVDYHGEDGNVVARVPVQLSGAIVPGASMVYSEQQHTLSGAAVQLANAPPDVTFTVTSATVGTEGVDMTEPLTVDAGARASG
jgi:hypothetical protein